MVSSQYKPGCYTVPHLYLWYEIRPRCPPVRDHSDPTVCVVVVVFLWSNFGSNLNTCTLWMRSKFLTGYMMVFSSDGRYRARIGCQRSPNEIVINNNWTPSLLFRPSRALPEHENVADKKHYVCNVVSKALLPS